MKKNNITQTCSAIMPFVLFFSVGCVTEPEIVSYDVATVVTAETVHIMPHNQFANDPWPATLVTEANAGEVGDGSFTQSTGFADLNLDDGSIYLEREIDIAINFDVFSYFTVLNCLEIMNIAGSWDAETQILTDLTGTSKVECSENGTVLMNDIERPLHLEDPGEVLVFLDDGAIDTNFVSRFAIPAFHIEFTLDTDLN